MGISGIESSGLSEENKKALQSETWQKVREGMKARREIKHFSEEADTGYGAEWHEVVNKYLKTAYKEEDKGCELEVAGVVYRALRRDKVTAFYNSDGDTLFDVTNEQLEKEYEFLEKDGNPTNSEEPASEEQKKSAEKDSPVPAVISENVVDVKERAQKKLEDELKNAKDKSFAELIIKYLLGRCKEDKGLSEDVLQMHKTWEKCLDYVYSLARKQASGNCVAVRDEVVYEWVEDYYHKDDKAEEEKKAKREKDVAERKAAKVKVGTDKVKKVSDLHKIEVPKAALKLKKNGEEMDGQLDMFSMMGI